MLATTTAGVRRWRRLSLLWLSVLLLSAALLAAASPSSSDDSDDSEDEDSEDDYEHYDSMIDRAMSMYISRSPGLVGRALREAGAEGVAMSTSVDGTGAVVLEDDLEVAELYQAEFAVEAIEREIRAMVETMRALDDEDDGGGGGGPYVRDGAEGVAEEFRDASYGDMYNVNPLKMYNEGKEAGGKQAQGGGRHDEDEDDEDD